MPKGFLTTKEAGFLLGVTPGRVVRMIEAGVMRGEKIAGQAYLIPLAEVEKRADHLRAKAERIRVRKAKVGGKRGRPWPKKEVGK